MEEMNVSFEGKTINVKKISVDNGNYIIYEGNDGKYYLDFQMNMSAAGWSVTVELPLERVSIYTIDESKFEEIVEYYRTQEYKKIEKYRQKTGWYERVGQVRKKSRNPGGDFGHELLAE